MATQPRWRRVGASDATALPPTPLPAPPTWRRHSQAAVGRAESHLAKAQQDRQKTSLQAEETFTATTASTGTSPEDETLDGFSWMLENQSPSARRASKGRETPLATVDEIAVAIAAMDAAARKDRPSCPVLAAECTASLKRADSHVGLAQLSSDILPVAEDERKSSSVPLARPKPVRARPPNKAAIPAPQSIFDASFYVAGAKLPTPAQRPSLDLLRSIHASSRPAL